ncbi:cation:proton antiporter [Serratia ureilytica]
MLLSESTFRHQLEADIEPLSRFAFWGCSSSASACLSIWAVVARNWPLIVSGVLAMMFIKGLCICCVARLTKSSHGDALDRAVLGARGEFAFVLLLLRWPIRRCLRKPTPT